MLAVNHAGKEFLGQEERGEEVRLEGDAIIVVRPLRYGLAAREPGIVDYIRLHVSQNPNSSLLVLFSFRLTQDRWVANLRPNLLTKGCNLVLIAQITLIVGNAVALYLFPEKHSEFRRLARLLVEVPGPASCFQPKMR